MSKVINRRWLDDMPFDRWDSVINNFVHATGDEVLIENEKGERRWQTEYEDDWTVDETAPYVD